MNDDQNTAASSRHTEAQREEAFRYALLLEWGSRIGVLAVLLSFLAYVFGILAPHVPLDTLPGLWSLPVSDYLQRTATPAGWGWLSLVHPGDMANLLGIALLTGCSMVPLLGMVWLYARRHDVVYALICTLILAVLVLAASGILTLGN
ncbi:MAG: hypothetical protein RL300_751 [Pseudomonadota bacterium]